MSRNINITSISKHTANVEVDGVLVGEATACEGCWIVLADGADWEGGFPCDDAAGRV